MAVGDFVAEPLGVGLDRIAVNLETVLVLENPFTRMERILRSMKQAEVNDWFGVVAVFVEPFRDIAIIGMSALRALITLNLDGDLIEAILGDEDGEDSIRSVAVLPDRGFTAMRTGPRVSDPLALKSVKPAVLNRGTAAG
ncbi:hypothetical protein [Halococcus sp. AFM35]|uniref:hypothetical protein n=1 Tax=Halococcus sp. AFM35 TaxID=3421653 RepID=UPI003EB9C384